MRFGRITIDRANVFYYIECMKKNKIIGRNRECERLQSCMNDDDAQLIVVYGRRRVGKTYLINQFFENKFAFKLTGAYNQKKDVQLRNFTAELERNTEKKQKKPCDWIEAFTLLRIYLERLPSDEKHVVFFDEMPWLDTYRSGFLSAFEWFWNDFGCTMDNLVFIVCGSATSWMTEKIDKNKGGLFNRQTCRLYLNPFSLAETSEYLNSKGFMWSLYEMAECYMIMGGIPYYLSLLKKQESFNQNIDRLFFENKGELWDEFNNLYSTLFSNSDSYIKVVEALGKKSGGMTRNEIISATGMPSNGAFSKMLSNLVDSGFLRIYSFYGRKKKEALYQLADYYTAFYLHFVKDNYGRDEHFWSNSIDNPSRRVWEGLTFEQLCKDHIKQIKHKIGILGVLSEESSWFNVADEDRGIDDAQIDLLIERRDRVINLCEIKFYQEEFIIDKSYDMVLRNKVGNFIRATETKKSIQLTMVTTYGLRQGKYNSIVSNEVTLEDLFLNV